MVRLKDSDTVKDHDLLQGQEPDDHHPQGTSFTVIINAQVMPGLTAYEKRINLGRDGHKTLRGILRGSSGVGGQGHTGCFFVASEVSAEGVGMSTHYSGYAYMGAFSRLHGDSYLSKGYFGSSAIALRDAYIDGDEAVLEFYNLSGSTRTLTVYGTVACK